MKKLLLLFFSLFLINISFAATPNFDVYCNSAILIDARTGNVLYEKNSNQQAYPASTTKILTAYIALTQIGDTNTEIIPTKNALKGLMYPAQGVIVARPATRPTIISKKENCL